MMPVSISYESVSLFLVKRIVKFILQMSWLMCPKYFEKYFFNYWESYVSIYFTDFTLCPVMIYLVCFGTYWYMICFCKIFDILLTFFFCLLLWLVNYFFRDLRLVETRLFLITNTKFEFDVGDFKSLWSKHQVGNTWRVLVQGYLLFCHIFVM